MISSPEQLSISNVLSERTIHPMVEGNMKNINRGNMQSRKKSLLGSNSESKRDNILGLKRQFSLDHQFMQGSAGKMKITTPQDNQPLQLSPLGQKQHLPLVSMKSLPLHAQAVDLYNENLFKPSSGSNSKMQEMLNDSPDVFGEKAPKKKRATFFR